MTNVLTLPSVSGSYTIANDAYWRTAWTFPPTGTAIDLTGIAFHLQMRPVAGSTEIDLDLSTAGGALTNGGTSGVLSLIAPLAMLQEIPPGAYVADLVATADGATINLCAGAPLAITVVEGVTW